MDLRSDAGKAARNTGSRLTRKYFSGVALFLFLIVIALFWGVDYRNRELVNEQLKQQAQTLFRQLELTREWIAGHGGVYVRQAPAGRVVPAAAQLPGVKAVVRDQDGEIFTLKHQSVATRELSELSSRQGVIKYRISSLKPLNPVNAPDAFEQTALESFSRGDREYFAMVSEDSQIAYRYMAPLVVQQSCLPCHDQQGYRVGDVLGGVSVTLSATHMLQHLQETRLYLIVSALGILIVVLVAMQRISSSYGTELAIADRNLTEMTARDPLTGLLSRNETFLRLQEEQSRAVRFRTHLSIIIINIDHFNRVNDTYGHATGDRVLQEIATMLRSALRNYDIICRYGGGEFLVATPDTIAEDAFEVADRMRHQMYEQGLHLDRVGKLDISVSAGVAELLDDENADGLIKRATRALGRAKAEGRNQVRMAL
jgi:diguanylate cyclase (GGDEF)-like protein